MDDKWANIVQSLADFKNQIMKNQMQHVILLMGNEQAGKAALANYIAGSDLSSEVDEEGQDILKIQNQLQTIIVVQDLLQIILAPEQSILFIKITGFPNQSKPTSHNEKWSLTIDYILYLLNVLRQQVCVSIILVFSLMQIQQNPQLLVQYKNALQNVNQLAKQTHIVLSRLVDEDQFNQFVQITAQNLIEETPQSAFIKEIIQERRIYSFYTHDANKQEQSQLKQNIYMSQPTQKFQLTGKYVLLKQNLSEDESHTLFDYAYQKLTKCLLLINYSLIEMILMSFQIPKDNKISQKFKNICGQIIEQNLQFKATHNLKSEGNIKTLMLIYQTLRKIIRQDKNQFTAVLFSLLSKFQQLWDEQLVKKGIISKMEIFLIICEECSENNLPQIKSLQIVDIFINHSTGSLEDYWILKAFPKCQQFISSQLVEELKARASNPKKKKVIKSVRKNGIPNYEVQYKTVLERNLIYEEVRDAPISPLKLQFLLDQLNRRRKMPKRMISQQKQITKRITQLLKTYKLFEQAIKFAMILPNILELHQLIILYLDEKEKNKSDISNEGRASVLKACQMFTLFCREKYKQNIENKIEQFIKATDYKNMVKLKQQLASLSKKWETLKQNQSDAAKTLIIKYFMDYQNIQMMFSQKKQLIGKGINFEYKNPTLIETELVKDWILNGAQFKTVT